MTMGKGKYKTIEELYIGLKDQGLTDLSLHQFRVGVALLQDIGVVTFDEKGEGAGYDVNIMKGMVTMEVLDKVIKQEINK